MTNINANSAYVISSVTSLVMENGAAGSCARHAARRSASARRTSATVMDGMADVMMRAWSSVPCMTGGNCA